MSDYQEHLNNNNNNSSAIWHLSSSMWKIGWIHVKSLAKKVYAGTVLVLSDVYCCLGDMIAQTRWCQTKGTSQHASSRVFLKNCPGWKKNPVCQWKAKTHRKSFVCKNTHKHVDQATLSTWNSCLCSFIHSTLFFSNDGKSNWCVYWSSNYLKCLIF